MNQKRASSVTSFDVARRAGVSRSTVSIVINSTPGIMISDKTRQTVWNAVKELNYHPNTIARSMRNSRSTMLGLVVGIHPTGHFLSNLLAGIQDTASAAGYSVVLAGTGLDERKMESYASMYLRRQVDGLVVALYTSRTDPAFLAPLKATGMPIVVVNGGFRDEDVGSVQLDHDMGAREATRHLIGLGHCRIGLVAVPSDPARVTPAQALRVKGYLSAMSEYSLEPLIYSSPGGTTWMNRQTGHEVARGALGEASPMTACYCVGDNVAFGVMDAARELGIGVPHQLAIVGSDNHPGSQVVWPALSTIALPHFEAGRASARMLIDHLDSGRPLQSSEVLLPCRLVVRESCGVRETGPVA